MASNVHFIFKERVNIIHDTIVILIGIYRLPHAAEIGIHEEEENFPQKLKFCQLMASSSSSSCAASLCMLNEH